MNDFVLSSSLFGELQEQFWTINLALQQLNWIIFLLLP